ncbi:phosphotriesterase family protein, partial [Rhodococcus chondri]|nr:phosphotriesterase [Rhodococcus sp. CC-R104]
EESLFRGAARTALATGVAVSIRYGADALHDLDIVLDEKLPADRVVVGGLDRADAHAAGAALAIARRGAYVALDHVGTADDAHLADDERATLVRDLIDAGHGDRILLSSNATGVSKGEPGREVPFSHILSTFVPLLTARGIGDPDIARILTDNPRALLSLR